eukprot:2964181-Lingulodinium_polyedra.AAC.1
MSTSPWPGLLERLGPIPLGSSPSGRLPSQAGHLLLGGIPLASQSSSAAAGEARGRATGPPSTEAAKTLPLQGLCTRRLLWLGLPLGPSAGFLLRATALRPSRGQARHP